MTVKKITPYLFFNGDAEEAIRHYQSALKAEVEGLLRWGDQPGGCPEGMKGRVMHAALHVGDALLKVSDSPGNKPASQDREVSIAIELDDVAEMTAAFDALADGGSVIEKIHDAFWGDKFGIVKDAYGIVWMFTCSTESAQE